MPTFSRQTGSGTADADQPVAVRDTTPVRERTDATPAPRPPVTDARSTPSSVTAPSDSTTTRWDGPKAGESETQRAARLDDEPTTANLSTADVSTASLSTADDRDAANRAARVDPAKVHTDSTPPRHTEGVVGDRPPVVAGPKPRASLLATLSLIFGVAAALLVLSGPLLGYGIGVAAVALVLALAGIRATGRRHVAGKTDALIGMVLALGAIVVGVLALTGSLNWLGTDTQTVTNLREWLDTQFVDRF